DTAAPVRQETTPGWRSRAAEAVGARLRGLTRLQRAAAAYLAAALPVALCLCATTRQWRGLLFWALGGLGVCLLSLYEYGLDLRLRWALFRRGVTVVAGTHESRWDLQGTHQYVYHFHDTRGRRYECVSSWPTSNGELRYDPEDPSRSLVSSWARLPVMALVLTPLVGAPGVACVLGFPVWAMGVLP
ncbi:hypothetical protein, partial [Streptomyces sp. UNOC14_S4]|uniref:hypothetical protein n=1 Tax=Streptomyces sp. UNOC14_S4 TaxID=2872340 RepID=UPI001E3DF0D5